MAARIPTWLSPVLWPQRGSAVKYKGEIAFADAYCKGRNDFALYLTLEDVGDADKMWLRAFRSELARPSPLELYDALFPGSPEPMEATGDCRQRMEFDAVYNFIVYSYEEPGAPNSPRWSARVFSSPTASVFDEVD